MRGDFGARACSKRRKMVSDSWAGTGVTAQHRGRIRAQRNGDREWLARAGEPVIAEVEKEPPPRCASHRIAQPCSVETSLALDARFGSLRWGQRVTTTPQVISGATSLARRSDGGGRGPVGTLPTRYAGRRNLDAATVVIAHRAAFSSATLPSASLQSERASGSSSAARDHRPPQPVHAVPNHRQRNALRGFRTGGQHGHRNCRGRRRAEAGPARPARAR